MKVTNYIGPNILIAMQLKKLIEEFGISSDSQLRAICKKLKIKLIDVGFAEIMKFDQNGGYIINLGDDNVGGSHWTAMWIDHTTAFYFDSFAVPMEDIVIKKIELNNPNVETIIYNDFFEFQGIEENLCGIWCVIFLYFMSKSKLPLIDKFKSMTQNYKDLL